MEMFGTDFVAASAFFAIVNSGQSIAEFLLNPLLGSLSDRFGRRAFLMAWPPINTATRILVVLYPSQGVVLAQQILVKMLEYTFEKAIAASVSDIVEGDRRSVVSGNVSMLKIGVGFLLGAGFISRFSATDPRPGYYACAAATALASVLMAAMPETLAQANRKPIDWGKTQPLSFLELLRPSSGYNKVSNGAAWRLALVAGMQKGSNKGVEQCLNVFTRERLAWTAAQMSTYKMVEAVGGFISGNAVGQTLQLFGKRWAVVFGNLVSATAWATIGSAASTLQVLAGTVLMYPFGVYLRPSVETALTKHADAAGIGQGMLQGQLANLVAVVKILAPPIYLQFYKWGMARGVPAAPFLLYSCYFVLNAGLLLSVPLDQL
eukprot:COSAG06_NODE_226_length_19747_cov_9.234121_10_plen_377_part_00